MTISKTYRKRDSLRRFITSGFFLIKSLPLSHQFKKNELLQKTVKTQKQSVFKLTRQRQDSHEQKFFPQATPLFMLEPQRLWPSETRGCICIYYILKRNLRVFRSSESRVSSNFFFCSDSTLSVTQMLTPLSHYVDSDVTR